jgi:flagellar protein FliO/FliZ
MPVNHTGRFDEGALVLKDDASPAKREKTDVMEFIDLLRYFGALLLVLAMVGGAGLLARRFGVPGIAKASAEKRLSIVETLMVGPRQRLFIVRRDDVEHLVLSGPDGATVVENGIKAQNNFGATP